MSDLNLSSLPGTFNKQFLGTSKPLNNKFLRDWNSFKLASYYFYIHPNQDVTYLSEGDISLLLIGNLYDYRNPEWNNNDILNSILKFKTSSEVLNELFHFTGEYVIASQDKEEVTLANDASALMEVYYSSDFSAFGSQPNLLSEIVNLEVDTDETAATFYNSKAFKERKFYLTYKTEFSNLLHLKPNYALLLNEKSVKRFYPNIEIAPQDIKRNARKMCTILSGYMKSVSLRKQASGGIGVPITAGWDSRILLAATIHAEALNARYFTIKHASMSNDHQDIKVAKRIASHLKINLEILTYEDTIPDNINKTFQDSLAHNRSQSNASIYQTLYKEFEVKDTTIINGNVSEIARSFYPNILKLNGKDIALLYGYPNAQYAIDAYNEWLKDNNATFRQLNYNVMDMFYWEERVGNWFAKMKSAYLLFSDHFSPFNSRILLHTALASKREERDAHFNILYKEILSILSKDLNRIPINPSPKTKIIKFMKQAKFYPVYQNIGIKTGLLKFN